MRRPALPRIGPGRDRPGAGHQPGPAATGPTPEWASRAAIADLELRSHPELALCDVFGDWSIADFGRLFLVDLGPYPALAARLPRMPSEEIQRRYTWWHGEELMKQSVEFTEAMRRLYESWHGRPLREATVLDYGAGWGRLTRMLLRFVPEDRIRACDAWPQTVDIFDGLGFRFPCDLVEPVPRSLPYERDSIDVAWLFSVLTHLPADASAAVMGALLPVVRPGGIVIATIRPEGFWRTNPLVKERGATDELVAAHRRDGFAHLPHPTAPVWGDSSMSVEYAMEHFAPWEIVATEDNSSHQVRIVFRRPPAGRT